MRSRGVSSDEWSCTRSPRATSACRISSSQFFRGQSTATSDQLRAPQPRETQLRDLPGNMLRLVPEQLGRVDFLPLTRLRKIRHDGAHDLSRPRILARDQRLEACLPASVVQDRGEDAVDEPDDRRVAAEGDLEPARAPPRACHDLVVHVAVAGQVRARCVDRLLEIAHDGKVLRIRLAECATEPRHTPQHLELERIGILRLVQQHTVVLACHFGPRRRIVQHAQRQADLVVVSHQRFREPEPFVRIGHAPPERTCRVVQPRMQRREGLPVHLSIRRGQFRRWESGQRPKPLPSPPCAGPCLGACLRARDAALGCRMKARRIEREQRRDVRFRQGRRGELLARRNDAAQSVKLLRRVKVEQLGEMRIVREGGIESALQKPAPRLFLVLQQRNRRRQAEVMAEAVQQPHAEAVDRAEERLLKCALHLGQNGIARPRRIAD